MDGRYNGVKIADKSDNEVDRARVDKQRLGQEKLNSQDMD